MNQVKRVMDLARLVFPDNWISVEETVDPTIVDFVHEERMTRNLIDCGLSDSEITNILITIKEGKCPGRTDVESATQGI
jgi:hypothetical protein